MKYLVFSLLVFFCFQGFAQKELRTTQKAKVYTIEGIENNSGEKLHVENKSQYITAGDKRDEGSKTVEYYDQYIRDIEVKVDIVKNDEEENKKAIESGWFDEMAKYIVRAKTDREKLILSKQTSQGK